MPTATVYPNTHLSISVFDSVSVMDVFGKIVQRLGCLYQWFSTSVLYAVKQLLLDMIFIALNNHASPPAMNVAKSQIKSQNRA